MTLHQLEKHKTELQEQYARTFEPESTCSKYLLDEITELVKRIEEKRNSKYYDIVIQIVTEYNDPDKMTSPSGGTSYIYGESNPNAVIAMLEAYQNNGIDSVHKNGVSRLIEMLKGAELMPEDIPFLRYEKLPNGKKRLLVPDGEDKVHGQ